MMELMNVNMKKIISILLPAALLFCSAGNASGEAAETDCYRADPEVTPVSTGEVSADSAGNLADYGIDPEEALRKMRECIAQELPAGTESIRGGRNDEKYRMADHHDPRQPAVYRAWHRRAEEQKADVVLGGKHGEGI